MTREEAITILKDISWQMGSVKRWENIEAIDMAIEALSAEHSEPIVVKCEMCYSDEDFAEWARKLREQNPNHGIVVVPYNAECVDYVPLNAVELTEEAKAKMRGGTND